MVSTEQQSPINKQPKESGQEAGINHSQSRSVSGNDADAKGIVDLTPVSASEPISLNWPAERDAFWVKGWQWESHIQPSVTPTETFSNLEEPSENSRMDKTPTISSKDLGLVAKSLQPRKPERVFSPWSSTQEEKDGVEPK